MEFAARANKAQNATCHDTGDGTGTGTEFSNTAAVPFDAIFFLGLMGIRQLLVVFACSFQTE